MSFSNKLSTRRLTIVVMIVGSITTQGLELFLFYRSAQHACFENLTKSTNTKFTLPFGIQREAKKNI